MQKKLLVHSCRLQQTDSWWQGSLFHSKLFFSFLFSFSFFYFFLSLSLFFPLSLSLSFTSSLFLFLFLSLSYDPFHHLIHPYIYTHTSHVISYKIYMYIYIYISMVNMFTLSAHQQQSKQCSRHTHRPKNSPMGRKGRS